MTNPPTGAPMPPDSHAYAVVDDRDDTTRLVELMEYMGRHPSSKRLYEGTRAEMHNGNHVLDIGCGTAFDAGTMALLVGQRGSVACVDFSQAMIDHAIRVRGSLARVSFEVGDVRKLKYSTATFDVVRCIRVLHHLAQNEPQTAIAEMRRVLKPGGKLVIAEPAWTRFSFHGHDQGAGVRVTAEMTRHFARHQLADQLIEMMQQAGLSGIKCVPIIRQVEDLADFDRFYGFERAVSALKAAKNPPAGIAVWEGMVRTAAANGSFSARLPIPIVIGTKR